MAFDQIPVWQHLKVSRENGIAEVTLHTNEGPLVWEAGVHRDLTELFAWLAFDRSTNVLILTGTGDSFCATIESARFREMSWREIWSEGRRLLCGLLDLDILVVTVVNGPALIHSELAVMADVVLACPEAEFADRAHFPRNIVPGDGVNLVWGNLLGPSRAGYFLLTGASIGAEEGLRLGFVHEIHPRAQLISRAREIARSFAEKSPAVVAYTRSVLRMRERRGFREDLSHGLGIEGLAQHALGLRGPE